MSNAHALLLGRTLGNKYVIEQLIGTGGMGAVYRARQIALDKWVAVKVLHRDLAGEPKFVARFQREALSASRLDHPNSLRVLDFGEDGGILYLVLEFVDAEDLLAVMNREWPLADERVIQILAQVLAALSVAHDFGIVHRDLKPENILVLRGEDDDGTPMDLVKVCDFGVAKLEPRGACLTSSLAPHVFGPHLTVDGLAIGTPDYMSPEQARGEAVDGRSDIYSLGVVLYHLLAGRPPFVSDSALGVALQHVSDQPIPPSRYRNVDPDLEAICLRALSKNPNDRFDNAREMRRALRAVIHREPRSIGSTPPLVLSQSEVTPRLGTSPPAGITLNPAEPALFARSKSRGRGRRAFALGIAAAFLGLLGAASSPTIRQTIDQRLTKQFEVVQTVAAAMGETPPHRAPVVVDSTALASPPAPLDAAVLAPVETPQSAEPPAPEIDLVPQGAASATPPPPHASRSRAVTPATGASASQPAAASSSDLNRSMVTARAGLPGTTVRSYSP